MAQTPFMNNKRYSPFDSEDDIDTPWDRVDFAPPEGAIQPQQDIPESNEEQVSQSNTTSRPNSALAPLSFEERMKIVNETGPAAKALQAYLEHPPSYAPDKMTRIGAIMGGVGASIRDPERGPLVTQALMQGPYRQRMNDWMQRGKALEQAASVEDRNYRGKVALLSSLDRAERQGYTENRNAINDPIRNERMQAETRNYNSLVKARGQGWSFHKNATDGHLIGIAKDGSTKDFGVMDLTPQQQQDLKINTFQREEDIRNKGRKNLFEVESPQIESRQTRVHATNRKFDIANPLPSRAASARESYIPPNQQTAAMKQAMKELSIENPNAGYSKFINADGTMKSPEDLGGWFSSASDEQIQGLTDFYNKVKARADVITSKTRKPRSESTAVASPKVKDPRIQ